MRRFAPALINRAIRPTARTSLVTAVTGARSTMLCSAAVAVNSSSVQHCFAARSSLASNVRSFQSCSALRTEEYRPSHGPRPTSPHLEIYNLPLPAYASITTRATGVALSIGLSGMAILALEGIEPAAVVYAFKESAPILVPIAKGLVGFPIVFHTVSGIRHMCWDATACGLTLPEVHQSTQFVIGLSALLTVLLMFYSAKPGKPLKNKK